MKIKLRQEVWEIENSRQNAEAILRSIEDALDKGDWQLSYLIINGEKVEDNYADYISEHINEIQEIEVMVLTLSEVVQDTIVSTEQYLARALPLITELAESFYQKADNDAWLSLTDLVEGLQWIIKTMAQIDSLTNLNSLLKDHKGWNEYLQEAAQLNNVIPELGAAIENKDNILLGDLLLFELIPTFEKMRVKLQPLIIEVVDEQC
ncbi:MAG: hypothetical protein WAO57_12510 [Syntrophomonadaceae bacterium]